MTSSLVRRCDRSHNLDDDIDYDHLTKSPNPQRQPFTGKQQVILSASEKRAAAFAVLPKRPASMHYFIALMNGTYTNAWRRACHSASLGNRNESNVARATKPTDHHRQPVNPWVWYTQPESTVPSSRPPALTM